MTNRYKNSQKDSSINAILTCIDNCGAIGARFSIQYNDYSMKDFPKNQVAEFLNDAVGNKGSARIISKELEENIAKDFADSLEVLDGQYYYIGSKFIDRYNYYSSSYEESKEEHSLLAEINSLPQIEGKGLFSDETAEAVLQHTAAITGSNSDKPILGTYGAGPCVIIAAYNPSTNQALLMHIDGLTSLSSLTKHIDSIANGITLQIHLRGGDGSSKKMCTEIIKLLKSRDDIQIISANIGTGGNAKSLAIDSRTGEIFTNFSPKQLHHEENYNDKIKLVAMRIDKYPIELSFDGTKKDTYLDAPVDETEDLINYQQCSFEDLYLEPLEF